MDVPFAAVDEASDDDYEGEGDCEGDDEEEGWGDVFCFEWSLDCDIRQRELSLVSSDLVEKLQEDPTSPHHDQFETRYQREQTYESETTKNQSPAYPLNTRVTVHRWWKDPSERPLAWSCESLGKKARSLSVRPAMLGSLGSGRLREWMGWHVSGEEQFERTRDESRAESGTKVAQKDKKAELWLQNSYSSESPDRACDSSKRSSDSSYCIA